MRKKNDEKSLVFRYSHTNCDVCFNSEINNKEE